MRLRFANLYLIEGMLLLSLFMAVWQPSSALSSLPVILVLLISSNEKSFDIKTALQFILLGWLIWLPINAGLSISLGVSINYVGVLILIPLAYFAGRILLEQAGTRRKFEDMLWLLLGFMSVWAIMQDPKPFHDPKAQGPFSDPNLFAAFLNLLFLPLLYGYMSSDLHVKSVIGRVSRLTILACTLLAIFMISSRGAMLSLILFMPIIIWQCRNKSDFNKKILNISLLLVVTYCLAYWIKQGAGTLLTRLAYTASNGDESRMMLLHSTLEMIQQHPVIGTGLGTFRLTYPRYRNIFEIGTAGGWAHNDYLQFWQEGGIPLFVLIVLLTFWLLKYLVKMFYERSGAGVRGEFGYACGAISVCLQANLNFVLYSAPVVFLFGLYLAVIDHSKITNSSVKKSVSIHVPSKLAQLYLGVVGWFLLSVSVVVTTYEKGVGDWLVGKMNIISRYDLARALSALVPYYPTPHHVMAEELLVASRELSKSKGYKDSSMVAKLQGEAMVQLAETSNTVPCYMPFAIDALKIRLAFSDTKEEKLAIRPLVKANLECNPRHGLTYYYAGMLEMELGQEGQALVIWRNGLKSVLFHSERLMLLAKILAAEDTVNKVELNRMAGDMAARIEHQESKPETQLESLYWFGVQHRLRAINNKALNEVLAVTATRNRQE